MQVRKRDIHVEVCLLATFSPHQGRINAVYPSVSLPRITACSIINALIDLQCMCVRVLTIGLLTAKSASRRTRSAIMEKWHGTR